MIEAQQWRRQRASRAGAAGEEQAEADLVQFVTFLAAGAECALPCARVLEVVEVGVVLPHPAARGAFRGTIALSTGITPVLDLSARLGAGETPIARPACAIVLERPFGRELPLALLVEAFRDLVAVPRAELMATPPLGGTPPAFGQMARLHGRLLPVLDLGRLLTAGDETVAAAITHDGLAPEVPGARPQSP